MPLSPTQRASIGGRDAIQEFQRYPEDLVGIVESVTISPYQASIILVTHDATIEISLYSDDEHPGSLTPRDGMWRGAILGLAQRAMTHQHKVTVATVERRIETIHVWIALAMTVHKGGI
jgi:hypothetical protein